MNVGTQNPLLVKLDEPLDCALMRRMIVVTSDGSALAGDVQISAGERTWSFIPKQPWPASDLQLTIDEHLEDLAGNTPARVFDTDLVKKALPPPKLKIPIRVAKTKPANP